MVYRKVLSAKGSGESYNIGSGINISNIDLIKKLFGDKSVEFNLDFNGLKDCQDEEDTWKYKVSYSDFINRVK